LRTPIIHLLFQRGSFDYYATQMTARALLCYSFGLWAIAGVRTVVPAFYALQDTWTPLKIALVCLGANILLNALLIGPLKHAGLALATSLASMLNLILLFRYLSAELGQVEVRKSIESLLHNLTSSLPMGLAAYLICSFKNWTTVGQSWEKVIFLGLGIFTGFGIYLLSSYWRKNEEMLFVIEMLKKRK
jgi:putative peptidoglycan lipid II flippase